MSEEIEENRNHSKAGLIQNMGMLDLRSAKTAEDLKDITGIKNVGCVVIPEHLVMILMNNVVIENVGGIVPVPEGQSIQFRLGQTRTTGEALAAGNSEDTLFIVGQLFVSTPVTNVGYKEIRVHGQVMAPRGSETALSAKLGHVTGQIFYFPTKMRLIMGEETIGATFLELLPEPTALVVMGELTFGNDVTVEALQSKILEIVLMGEVKAPRALIPLVQVLAVEKMGAISATEGGA